MAYVAGATKWLGVGLLVALAALIAGVLVQVAPLSAVALPVVGLGAIAAARWPAAAAGVLFLLTGAYGSLAAFAGISAAIAVDALLAALWGATIWSYLMHNTERPAWLWPGVALLVVYAGLTLVAMLLSPDVAVAARSFRASGWYLMAALLIAYAPWFQDRRGELARAFLLVALLIGGYATLRWIFGQSGTETGYVLARSDNEVLDDKTRLFGSLLGGKQLAFWTAAAIPFCLACALTFAGRWRAVALAAAGACAVAMLGADVRVAVVAVVPAVLLVLALYQLARGFPGLHLGATAGAALVIACIGAGAFAFTLADSPETGERYRVLATSPTSDASYQARVFKWRTALEDVEDHPLGQGLGASGDIQQRFGRFANISTYDVDNSYLKIALEQGLPVMVLFGAALLALLLGLMRRAVLTLDPQRAGLAIGAAGTLVVFAIFMFAGTYVEGLPALAAWMLIGLGIAGFSHRPERR